jgi:hypothetical protein
VSPSKHLVPPGPGVFKSNGADKISQEDERGSAPRLQDDDTLEAVKAPKATYMTTLFTE